MNRIPGSCLLISSLPGLALRMHVKSLGKPRDSTSILKALPGKLYIKRHSPSILYVSQPCPVRIFNIHTEIKLSSSRDMELKCNMVMQLGCGTFE